MAYFINDDCVMCGSCKDECPTSAISEGDPKYTIESGKCDDCGTCAEVCPVGAAQPMK